MIAIDAMGGDFAPLNVLKGALAAARQQVPLMLFGPKKLLESTLETLDPAWRSYNIVIAHAPDEIGMAEHPVFAVKRKPHSSLVKAMMSVKLGECSAFVSAGNSGAILAAAVLYLGCTHGIDRPALAGLVPTVTGALVALDLGANVQCRANQLVQFAHLGVDFAEKKFTINQPRVALLANGHEDSKGSDLTKEAFLLLKQESTLNFIGNREPYDVVSGGLDVLVCDGFSGNIFIKTMEASCAMIQQRMQLIEKDYAGQSIPDCYQPVFDFKKYTAGAMLLGVNAPVIVCHGAASARAMERAIVSAG